MLQGKPPQKVTVRRVTSEEIGIGDQKTTKMVLYFGEMEQGLVLNKTNGKLLVKLFGDETDSWVGQTVELYVAEVEYQGEKQAGLRLRA